MGFYRLLPTAMLLSDEKGATIIDTISFRRINYSYEESVFLKRILEEAFSDFDKLNKDENRILQNLLMEGYCYYYENKPCNDTYIGKKGVEIRGLNEEIPHFTNIYLEVSTIHDLPNFGLPYIPYGCKTCGGWKRKKRMESCIDFDFEPVMKRLSGFWMDKITFSGGDPFANINKLKNYVSLIERYRSDIRIEMNIPPRSVPDELFLLLKEKQIVLNVTFFSNGSNWQDTQVPYWFDLVSQGIKCHFTCIGKLKKSFFQECEKLDIGVDIIDGNKTKRSSKDDYCQRIERESSNFWINHKFNSCLKNKLAITAEGMIRPCPMIEDDIIDLKSHEIDEVFQKQLLDKYWRFTKDGIDMCRNCRNRYICEDCAALEMSVCSKEVAEEVLCNRNYGG